MIAPTELVKELKGVSDEKTIKEICAEVMDDIYEEISEPDKRKNKLDGYKNRIKKEFPSTPEQKFNYQYFTNSGKGSVPRWQHLALKYLTLSEPDWDELGDENRQQWKAEQAKIEASSQPEIQSESNMTITLTLDSKAQSILNEAVNNSGLSTTDYILKAIEVYAKTVNRKSKRQDEDLSTVSTEELLNDGFYSTHPNRAEELVKRAIRAIKKYNGEVAIEPKQRWIITQSLLVELTKSRTQSVVDAMSKFQSDIDNYNYSKEEFLNEDGTLNKYVNRKKGVDAREEINLALLVPSGIDE
ncbi:MAG TPA: hypothetical protein VIQ31_10940 [Phormidium sp.]